MTGQGSVVGKDHIISYLTIVSDMRVSQEITVVPNDRDIADRGRPIHGHEFAETIVIPDFQVSWFAGILQILRLLADRTERVEPISFTDLSRTTNGDVML